MPQLSYELNNNKILQSVELRTPLVGGCHQRVAEYRLWCDTTILTLMYLLLLTHRRTTQYWIWCRKFCYCLQLRTEAHENTNTTTLGADSDKSLHLPGLTCLYIRHSGIIITGMAHRRECHMTTLDCHLAKSFAHFLSFMPTESRFWNISNQKNPPPAKFTSKYRPIRNVEYQKNT